MVKKPPSRKKKVRSRSARPPQTTAVKSKQSPAAAPKAASAGNSSETEQSKRPEPQQSAKQTMEPVETPLTAANPAAKTSQNVSSQTAAEGKKPASSAPAEPTARPVSQAAPTTEAKVDPLPKAPASATTREQAPAAAPKAAGSMQETAPQQPEPEPETLEPRPATRSDEPDTSRPMAMPAEAESTHVEEPVPDESPVGMPAAEHRPELFIVHISPEMAPVAKVGGLADVVFGLTGELAIRGNHVEVILPKYDNLRYDHIYEMHEVYNDLWVPWYDGAIHCTVFFGFVHNRKCFFIEPHSPDNFFNRGSVYGFADDILRFAFFSRAAMEFLWKSGKHPDIIHCHDWQTALVPILLYEVYQQMGMTHPRACFTIHNYKHQGVTGMEMLRATGLHDPDRYFDYNRLRDNNNLHALNLLKGGIVYSNFTTTVSPRYAMETKDLGQGFGLEPTLHTHQMKYGGVLNGIDYDAWNPELDHLLPARYGADNIDAKYENKRALRQRLMLADNEKPIVAFIGRLDPQKGLELVRHAIFQSLERGAQVVLLGSSPDPVINNDFWNLKGMLNDSPDCHLEIGYDEELAHLIYAGADIMLVPSQFEPCGLTQLISLRYGTIPVVRAVGGLADTVFDKDHSHRPLHERNGYVFDNYDNEGLESALIRAIDCYYQFPEHFRDLIRNAMRTDYSWNVPGQDYMNIYDFIRNK